MRCLKLLLTLTFITLALRPAFGQLVPVATPITSLPTNSAWYYSACSSNGAKWFISGYASNVAALYTSTNFGMTWEARTNFLGNVSCSADGRIVLCAKGGAVMLSTNFGDTWNSTGFGVTGPGSGYVSVSADGTKLAASGSLRISTNSGASWYSSPYGGGAVAWSGDGTHLAVFHSDGLVYVSTNNGTSWTPTASPQNNADWTSLAISGNGSVLAACSIYENSATSAGALYFSTNYGATWSFTGYGGWYDVSISADGKKLAAASSAIDPVFGYNSLALLSTDGGANWGSISLPLLEFYHAVTLSSDGSMMQVMNSSTHPSYRYIMAQPDAPALNIANGGGNASLTWPYLTPGYVLQQNTNLATTNWVTVTNTPAAVKQVILPPTNANNFYRLQKP